MLKNVAKKQTTRISREIIIVGPCEANNHQLISTCNKVKKGSKKSNSDKPISMDKIIYLGTFVKKLEQYENYSAK